MPQYLAPGVYIDGIDTYLDKIAKLRTDIGGFLGMTQKGPLNKPIRLESWKQFQFIFGDFIPQSYLAYGVKGFFENGGKVCYVVRIADLTKAKKAWTKLKDKGGNDFIEVKALNEGTWGNKIKVYLKESCLGSTTSSDPAKQEPNGKFSVVTNSIGFEKGSLVRIFQRKSGPPFDKHYYVKEVDHGASKITWENPLNIGGPGGLDLSKTIHFSTREFTLTFVLNNRLKEIFANLSINESHSRHFKKIINDSSHLVNVEVISSASPVPDNLPDPDSIVNGFEILQHGYNGINTIVVDDLIGDPSSTKKIGLRCFEDIDEISMVSMPDLMIQPQDMGSFLKFASEPCQPPISKPVPGSSANIELAPKFSEEEIERAQHALVAHCEEMKDRVAILDTPHAMGMAGVMAWRQKFNTSFAALYYPWIKVNDPLLIKGRVTRDIPPSGFITGVFARTDLLKGVHKAAANEELLDVKDTLNQIDDAEQELLNPLHINCIRSFPGRGILSWGTRSLSNDPLWKYINIRRLMIMIEESVEESMQWAVFEPHNVHLRNGIRLAVSSFLEELWKEGALTGSIKEEAFFVKCDETNNPPRVVDNGQVITDIGVAPSIPGEFIVFRIGKVKETFRILAEGAE